MGLHFYHIKFTHKKHGKMKKPMRPESLMMSYGYKPELSEGALKCPIFQTSTFVFKTAEEGKAFFELAYGLRDKGQNEELGLIYSRLNNPDLEILENRLCLWDGAEAGAVFGSGMSAISTVFLEFLQPGDLVLFSSPTYGGTDHFIHCFLHERGIHTVPFKAGQSKHEIIGAIEKSGHAARLSLIFVEPPANPTNALIDLRACRQIADHFSTEEKRVTLAVDNTYMGPLWQHPLRHGADLVIYSATKYISGHSDVIAGAVLGNADLMKRVKTLRTFLGNMASPWTGWLLMRSLETLKVRMEQQARNAKKVADFLLAYPKVERVYYLGHLKEGNPEHAIFKRQCTSPGAMVAFDIVGGEKAAFRFLNRLKLLKLAVSLGGTESLAQHPATMTHAGVDPIERDDLGISGKMVRISVGVENHSDILWDIGQALDGAQNGKSNGERQLAPMMFKPPRF